MARQIIDNKSQNLFRYFDDKIILAMSFPEMEINQQISKRNINNNESN